MPEKHEKGGLSFTVARSEGTHICYILLPQGLRQDIEEFIGTASVRYRCHIVAVNGMEWNDDMTPWPAEGVFRKAVPFGGKADRFLARFRNLCLELEEELGIDASERWLAGISLSGLFALWAAHSCDFFSGIACISGSFWYDGLDGWVAANELSPAVRFCHISLGDREKNSKDRRMATVEERTVAIVERLRSQGVHTDWQLIDGTHFSPVVPRLETALEALNAAE